MFVKYTAQYTVKIKQFVRPGNKHKSQTALGECESSLLHPPYLSYLLFNKEASVEEYSFYLLIGRESPLNLPVNRTK